MKKTNNFKKLSLLDLAAARIKNSTNIADVKKGDIVKIIAPFSPHEDMMGIVLNVENDFMTIFHSSLNKSIIWNRCVKCELIAL